MQGAKEAIGNITDNQPPQKSVSKIVDFFNSWGTHGNLAFWEMASGILALKGENVEGIRGWGVLTSTG